MSVNCNLGRYALLARRTDYFNDFAGGLLNTGRIVENANDDDLTMPGIACCAPGDQNPVCDLRVVRDDDANATFPNELTGNFANTSIKDLDQPAFGAAAAVFANNFYGYPVTVENRRGAITPTFPLVSLSFLSLRPRQANRQNQVGLEEN